jgi:hypothetical protein
MTKRINSLRQNIFNTILDPNSPDFPALMEAVNNYLGREDQQLRTDALLQLGLNKNENIVKAYRRATELSQQHNEHSAFYTLLEKSIKQYLEDIPQELGILTSDDLPLFIDVDKATGDQTVPTLDDMGKINKLIFQRTPQREYEVETERVSLGDMVPPNSLRVEFPKGHPNIFNIYFYYENEQGESTTLELNFDTRKNEFDWKPFAPDTSDPEMTELRKASLFASYSILSQIQQQTEAEYQQKQKERQVKTQTPQATVRQSRPKEPYVPRVKEKRQERPSPLSPIQEILQSNIPFFPETQRVRNQILVPEEEGFEDMIKGISAPDQKIIAEGIQNYNENGVGTFRMLKALGNEGQRLYALRVNCGPRGGSRVLLQESDSEETSPNIRKFQIVDIGYRKDIYRKRGL